MAGSVLDAVGFACIGTGMILDTAMQNGMFDFLPEYLGLKLVFLGFALDVIAALISVR